MKILLVNPAFNYNNKNLLYSEPLSLAYLAAYLANNYEIKILDAAAGAIKKINGGYHFGLMAEEIKERIKNFNPDLVGITCPFSLRNQQVVDIAKLVKSVNPKIIVVIGGIHPTIFPKETVMNESVDYAIIGEGEHSFLSLVKEIESGKPNSEFKVDGCAYKTGAGVFSTPKTEFIADLDSLPLPARDLLPIEFYISKPTIIYGLGRRRSLNIITSRSCPNHCTFCSMRLSHGSKWRGRSAENVFEEIKFLVDKYNIEELFIMDDNLTYDKDRIIKICELILKHGIKIKWNTPNGVAAIMLDEEVLKIMKKAGCINICIGVESGNKMVRNQIIRKGLSDETIRNVLNICKKVKMPVSGFFILGIPGENEETFKDTLAMIKKYPFSMVTTSFFTPLPGTEIYDQCVQNNYIKNDYWKEVEKFNSPIVETPDFSQADLRNWEKKLYIAFFKSHFWSLFFSVITFRNSFFRFQMIKRFVIEKIINHKSQC